MAPKQGKKKRGDSTDEEEAPVVQQQQHEDAKKKGGKARGAAAAAQAEEKPSKAAAKGKKRNQGDSDEEEVRKPAVQAEAGLSKTALLKAKRDAKKNKDAPVAAAAQGKGKVVQEEEEEEEEAAVVEEEEEEESELVHQIKNLAIEEQLEEESEEDGRIKKADKKKDKKSKEKKKKDKASHGIVDELELPPTPPPQLSKHDLPPTPAPEEEEEPAPVARQEEGNDNDDEEEEAEETTKASKKDGKRKPSNKERRKEKEAALLLEENTPTTFGDAAHVHPDNKVFAVSATSVNMEDEMFKNARDISIPSFSISTSGKTLFSNAELRIPQGRRFGFVGPNGLGKSVLLRAIANRDLPIPPSIDCLYVEQEVVPDEKLAVEVVLSADARRSFLIQREQELMAEMDRDEDASDEVHEEYLAVCEELRTSKAEAAEAKALNLLRGLGFSDEMARMPTKHLSGGWRMRVSIAKGLFIEPTLLLLDEPTNHLDLEAVIFLESVLEKWEKTLVIVSHDVGFLNAVCQEIIHLDSQKLWYYKGNYGDFEAQFEVERARRRKEYELHLKHQKEDQQMGMKLTAREQAKKQKHREAGASKQKRGKGGGEEDEEQTTTSGAGKGRGTVKPSAKMLRPRDYEVSFSFPEPTQLTPPIIQVRDVDYQYTPQSKRLFHQINFGIDMQSRVCIVGPNGSGKSTLIKLITQKLVPTEGEILCNRHVRVAVYQQHFVDELPMNETPVDYLRRVHNCEMQDCRGRLGRFGLPGTAHTIPLRSLSGGQKARVVFAHMSYQNPHIIVLDEPSNNLDMESIRALGEAINEFDGGVVLVSHDARLIEDTEMDLWVVENEGVTQKDLETYRGEILLKLERKELESIRLANEKQHKREQQVKALKLAREEKLAAKAAAAASTQ